VGQDSIQPSSDRREMLDRAGGDLQPAGEVTSRVEQRCCSVECMDDIIDRTAFVFVGGCMSRTQIEPLASLHLRTLCAIAVGLKGADEGVTEVMSESTELLVDPHLALDVRAGQSDDPGDGMGVSPDEMGDVFLELEGGLEAGQQQARVRVLIPQRGKHARIGILEPGPLPESDGRGIVLLMRGRGTAAVAVWAPRGSRSGGIRVRPSQIL